MIMKSLPFYSFYNYILILLLISACFSFSQPLCHDDERSSLLQFKQIFTVAKFASDDPLAYPKVASWKGEDDDCCGWDGVECDGETGHVISLDLSSSFLNGSVHSKSSLFSLVHLEMLNLADNHFSYSQIPSSIKQLSKLTYLNLSSSAFAGQIPPEISQLHNMSVLDLSHNIDVGPDQILLELRVADLRSLLQNMTRLEVLSLGSVYIPSAFPVFLANFSSLTSLNLRDCGLRGDFPVGIFQLPNLQNLNLHFNHLTGELPPFNQSSALKLLNVADNYISGELPASIGVLTSLTEFDAHSNNLSGSIPSSIGKLSQLAYLSLYENNLSGDLISSSLGNLTRLAVLDLATNYFRGPTPPLFSKLKRLESLNLRGNELSGSLDFDMFLSLKNLTRLSLSYNNLSLLIKPSRNGNPPRYTKLELAHCSLSSFPDFLRNQTRLEVLKLQGNHIGGLIPQWLMNMSKETLFDLNLANNLLRGEVSPEICNLKFLSVLSLSRNRLFGELPSCLLNFTKTLRFLNLGKNSFSGNIPKFGEGCQLKMIDFNKNQLQGKLRRSLKNCEMLEVLLIENNQLNDVFPHWLGELPKLRVLGLRNNWFHGVIQEPKTDLDFPELHIIDISGNTFTGKLPSKYIQNWKAMKHGKVWDLRYMGNRYNQLIPSTGETVDFGYSFHVMITIKGMNRYYSLINEDLVAVDLSYNYFDGEIPEIIGNLEAVHSIDLSGNNLSGGIPSLLGLLSKLESLDLSQNNLSGEIPQELTNLNFLQYFNVSHNCLTGPIPQGNQLSTFDVSSYTGNLGLCGIPLPDKCRDSDSKAPKSSIVNDSEEENGDSFGFGWKVVAIGYACGFLAGLFIGKVTIARRPEWFAMVFQVRTVQARRKRSVGRGN